MNRKALRKFLSSRPYRWAHLRVLVKDYFDLRTPEVGLEPTRNHLKAAMDWLCRAQDISPDGGVSARYRMDRGWTRSYPETTGYIAETFFDYAHYSGKQPYFDRALRMVDWLLTTQLPGGAFPGHDVSKKPAPRVFNTGQIMIGLIRAYRETGKEHYLEAARRAGDFLCSIQEDDGRWVQHAYYGKPHAYHARVAWPMLQLWEVTREPRYRESGERNLQWVLSLQQENGWFQCCGFRDDQRPFLHTIAYTIRGLLEGGVVLGGDRPLEHPFVQSAYRAAFALLRRFEVSKYLAGQLDSRWRAACRESCLTGNAQTSIIWLRLFQLNGDARYLNAALKINDFLKSTQELNMDYRDIYGAIKGSHPIWGRYISYAYPNWATKFFADALLLEEAVMHRKAVVQEAAL